jgi:hypothetical protein
MVRKQPSHQPVRPCMRHTPTQGLGTAEAGFGFIAGEDTRRRRLTPTTLTLTLSHQWERV